LSPSLRYGDQGSLRFDVIDRIFLAVFFGHGGQEGYTKATEKSNRALCVFFVVIVTIHLNYIIEKNLFYDKGI
jgi:hypothetical protein